MKKLNGISMEEISGGTSDGAACFAIGLMAAASLTHPSIWGMLYKGVRACWNT